jgi:hypothetical protein
MPKMAFREALPANCPPGDAHDGPCEIAYRLVLTDPPDADAFASAAAKLEPIPEGVSPCRWASCSLFSDLETVIKKRNTFKKLRKYMFAAQVNIPGASGKMVQDSKHIDFWMYDTFDPLTAVVVVKGL